MDIGNELRAWRARLNMTQAAAAAALGISLRTVQNWEARGSRGPDHPTVVRLACQRIEVLRRVRGLSTVTDQ